MHPSVCLSVCLPVGVCVCLSVSLYVCLSVCLSFILPVHVSLFSLSNHQLHGLNFIILPHGSSHHLFTSYFFSKFYTNFLHVYLSLCKCSSLSKNFTQKHSAYLDCYFCQRAISSYSCLLRNKKIFKNM